MRKVIIDTDPGIDDALAVLYAFASPDIEVVAMTSIFGNCLTPRATANIGVLQQFSEQAVPIGIGAHLPLFGPWHPPATFVHGEDGFGDCDRSVAKFPAAPDGPRAAQLIVDTVRATPGEITIVALGPLTNLALALAIEPRVADWTQEVVIMGGALGVPGNASPVAEANIIHDPYAAQQVLAASWPTVLVPLDVTMGVLMPPAFLDGLGATGEPGRFLREITRFYEQFHRTKGVEGIHAHDPTAMLWLSVPEAFSIDEGPVTVAVGGPAHGQTITDLRVSASSPVPWAERSPVRYGVSANSELLLDRFLSAFSG